MILSEVNTKVDSLSEANTKVVSLSEMNTKGKIIQ
jgi:hypothetical protein